MPYVNVVMPLMDFIPYVSDILIKKNGVLYVEKRSGDDSFSSIKVDQGNYESIVERNREKNLNFFIASKELESPDNHFYDDAICPWIIEGVGGRETDDAIERIALRLVSRNPEKETVKIFNAIKSKLKKDTAIGIGVEGGSPLHENYFYQKDNVSKKVFMTDINNDKSPVIRHHTESRHAGSVPGTAAATGTFGTCKARSLTGLILFVVLLLDAGRLYGQNPFLPPTAFIPDGEPHVFEYKGEKRVYVYGSRDERVTAYCGYGHDVWSAPVNDLTRWTNHGEILNVKQVLDTGYGRVNEQHFGAPDCVYNPVTQKYYLYTFLGAPYHLDGKEGPLRDDPATVPGFGDYGPKCVMAQSDSPTGPFINPVMCDWPALNDKGAFDPAVLVDQQEDGSVRVYAYWGMVKGDRCAELDPYDMHTIIHPETRKPDRNAFSKTLPDESMINGSSLFEASSIRKVSKDKYVFIYSPGEAHSTLAWCYANSPRGPWKYGGRIVDNQIGWRGGNDHGSIFEANGQWYVVYHRATNNSFNRQAMMEPVRLTVEGDRVVIPEVGMTSQGVLTDGLDPFRRYYAGIVCYRDNNAYIDGAQRNSDGMNPVVHISRPGTTLGYKYFNFGKKPLTDRQPLVLRLNVTLLQKAKLTVMTALPEQTGTSGQWVTIASVELDRIIPVDGRYHEAEVAISGLDRNEALQKAGGLRGKQAVYLKFEGEGGELCRLREIEFARKGVPTPNPLRDIQIAAESTGGAVTALPNRGRGGESVKLTVIPEKGYQLDKLTVRDDKGREIETVANALVPFGSESYHFLMPARAVKVTPEFIPARQ